MTSSRIDRIAVCIGGILVITVGFLPAAAAEKGLSPAVLLLHKAPDNQQMAEVQIRVARKRLQSAWLIEDAADVPGLARPDKVCNPESRGANAVRVIEGLRSGTTLFFDKTDMEGAWGVLQGAIDSFLDAPCVLAGDPAGRSEVASGAVLLVRLYLLAGRPEAAADLGRRLLRIFDGDELASVDVPPEVTRFLQRVSEDTAAGAVPFEIALDGSQPGSMVLFDGRLLPAFPAKLRVARGSHQLTVITDAAARTLRVQVEGPGRILVDLGLSSSVRPGPLGSIVIEDPNVNPGDLERRLSMVTGRTILRLTGVGAAGPVEAWLAVQPSRQVPAEKVLRLEGVGVGPDGPVVAFVSGPLLRRKSWPWPFVTGAVAAGLLAAGIVLNVQSNQAVDDINAGVNRLDDWRSRRAGSIACYSLAALAGAATITLAILGRPAPEHVVLSPIPGGVAVGYYSSF